MMNYVMLSLVGLKYCFLVLLMMTPFFYIFQECVLNVGVKLLDKTMAVLQWTKSST